MITSVTIIVFHIYLLPSEGPLRLRDKAWNLHILLRYRYNQRPPASLFTQPTAQKKVRVQQCSTPDTILTYCHHTWSQPDNTDTAPILAAMQRVVRKPSDTRLVSVLCTVRQKHSISHSQLAELMDPGNGLTHRYTQNTNETSHSSSELSKQAEVVWRDAATVALNVGREQEETPFPYRQKSSSFRNQRTRFQGQVKQECYCFRQKTNVCESVLPV